mgnify:CR=1 FL=1|jgi:hypothetical protein
MKAITVIVITIFTLTSCGLTTQLTDAELERRNKIQYEIDKVWSEYSYKTDSLWIEYHKKH